MIMKVWIAAREGGKLVTANARIGSIVFSVHERRNPKYSQRLSPEDTDSLIIQNRFIRFREA
jgi:hypothetical protein